jgi:hypothetical protein
VPGSGFAQKSASSNSGFCGAATRARLLRQTHIRVERATLEDVAAIHALTSRYEFAPDKDLSKGHLLKVLSESEIAEVVQHSGQVWKAESNELVEGDKKELLAVGMVVPGNLMSRPLEKHYFFPEFEAQVRGLLESGECRYFFSAAVAESRRGSSAMPKLAEEMHEHYRRMPTLGHIALVSQDDFDRAGRDMQALCSKSFNRDSWRLFVEKLGWQWVGYTSDLDGAPRYNTGLEPGHSGTMPMLGALVMRMPEGGTQNECRDPIGELARRPVPRDHSFPPVNVRRQMGPSIAKFTQRLGWEDKPRVLTPVETSELAAAAHDDQAWAAKRLLSDSSSE